MNIEKHTPLYTPLDIEYQQFYSGPYTAIDCNTYIAATKNGDITGYGRPTVGDVPFGRWLEFFGIEKQIWYLDFLEDNQLSNISRLLLKQGHRAEPYYTQIIDLTKSEEQLHADVRKSYKSLLNVTKKQNVVSLLWDIEPLRRLHIEAHGRQTRSKDTWFVQQKMIWHKQAFALVENHFKNMSLRGGVPVAGGLFYYNRHICYYGVGCSVEGAGSHAIIWQAIKHAKKLGCKRFDMGRQVFEGNDKLINISNFKRGFGGKTKAYLEFRP